MTRPPLIALVLSAAGCVLVVGQALGYHAGYERGVTATLSDMPLEDRVREAARVCTDARWAHRVDAVTGEDLP